VFTHWPIYPSANFDEQNNGAPSCESTLKFFKKELSLKDIDEDEKMVWNRRWAR
jgi:hypothetical protein